MNIHLYLIWLQYMLPIIWETCNHQFFNNFRTCTSLIFFFLRFCAIHLILFCFVSVIRFRNPMKQERSSQMPNLFLHLNFLEIKTRREMQMPELLCRSFQYVSFSYSNLPETYINEWTPKFVLKKFGGRHLSPDCKKPTIYTEPKISVILVFKHWTIIVEKD